METIRVSSVVIAFLLSFGSSAYANPIAIWFFNELQFTGNAWTLEMHASDLAGTLNGWYLQSNSGMAFFKNNIHVGNWYLLITQDSLLSSLSIDPLGDSLTIHSPGAGMMGHLTFGNCASALICSPRSGQSISSRGYDFYYLDNSPTLGQPNDSTNAMGTIRGFVIDSLGQPLPEVRASFFGWPGFVYSDSSGRFDIRDYARRCDITLTHSNCTSRNVTIQIWPESTVSVTIVMDRLSTVGADPIAQSNFKLHQNYPNPFNPATTFSFTIPRLSVVSLMVYDIFGKEVATVVNEVRNPGMNEAQWDASNVASGVYFYRLIADGVLQTRKMVLMR